MVGRKPKPTATKILSGNPGKRKLNQSEPKFAPGAKCPAHLDKLAKAEWRRLAPELERSGLLTSADRAALASYCQAWSRWVTAEQQIQAEGLVTIASKSGYRIQSPYVGIANTALDQMRKWATEFGLTPASRSRIHAEATGEQQDPFAEFMQSIGAAEKPTNADSA